MMSRESLLLTALCALLYVPPVALTPFYTKGEPREGLVVRQMVEEGDWILPKRPSASGATIASKPPFFHWMGALASRAVGSTSELTVRLPSLVLGTAAVLAVWRVGRVVLPPPAAFASAVMLATTFEWVRAASTARVDGALAALMTIGLMLLYRGFVEGGLTRAGACAVALSFTGAALTKGPVGFVLPALVLGVALIVWRRVGQVPRYHPVLIAVLIGTLVGAWYFAAWQLGGDAFVRKHVLKENVFRFLGSTELQSGHAHPFYYYVPTLALGLLPWTPCFLAALVAAAKSRAVRTDPRIGFPLVWFAVVLLFYSAASAKRSVYLLALYPAAALLAGWWWHERATSARPAFWLRGSAARAIVAAVAAILALPLIVAVGEAVGHSPLDAIAPFLHAKDRANLPIVQQTIRSHFPVVVTALGVMLGTLLVVFRALGRERWATVGRAAVLLAVGVWTLVFSVFQPELARRRSLRPFMARVAFEAGDEVPYFRSGTFDNGAAFYAHRGARFWRGREGEPVPHYLLAWEEQAKELVSRDGSHFEIVATSEGTDPKGVQHLSLVRRR